MNVGILIIVVTRLAVSSVGMMSVVSAIMVTIGATVVVAEKVVVRNWTYIRYHIEDFVVYLLPSNE